MNLFLFDLVEMLELYALEAKARAVGEDEKYENGCADTYEEVAGIIRSALTSEGGMV